MALTAVTALSCTFSAFASSSVPTAHWYLGTEGYSWSAYVNGYNLYSNYYFTTYDGCFAITGEKLYPCSKIVDITVYNYYNPAMNDFESISQSMNTFAFNEDYFTKLNNSETIYFSVDGATYGAEASLEGLIYTYLGIE